MRLFTIFLIALPFIIVFFMVARYGSVKSLTMLNACKSDLDNYVRVLHIASSTADSCKAAMNDLLLVEKSTDSIRDTLLRRTADMTVNDDDRRVIDILSRREFTTLAKGLSDAAKKIIEVSKLRNPTAAGIKQYYSMSDHDIVVAFVGEDNLKLCEDLSVVKRYIEDYVEK